MHVIAFIIAGCWIAFWLYWIAAAFRTKSSQPRWGQFAFVRILIVIVIILLDRVTAFHRYRSVTHNPVLQGIGLAIFLLGLGLAIWARLYIGRNWGMPMSRKNDAELVTTGPYRFIRNPIYSGILLGAIGTMLAVSLYWLVPVVLVGAYFIYSAVIEARDMGARFPDTYPAYKQSTKMMIPFIL